MLRLEICHQDGSVFAEVSGEDSIYLTTDVDYIAGDCIKLEAEEGFYHLWLDSALSSALVFVKGPYYLEIPFDEKKKSYPPSSFAPGKKYLAVRKAFAEEISNYRNLAFNPYDWHCNEGVFPHSWANVETRGESVFASRNAMDGVLASSSHGAWPFESWGINRNPDAILSLDFGRSVVLDRIVLYTRADFPHDAWWSEATIEYPNGEKDILKLEKKDGMQSFSVKARTVDGLSLTRLIKADDPSPFPALVQIEVWGRG